jgi:glycerophosphoryl diester phosphodiesterase
VELTQWKRAPGDRPLVLAHRGARRIAPENTLSAFEAALAEGADGVELDVRLSADHRIVVVHDPTLARCTAGQDPRAVSSLSYHELARIDLSGSRIPLLSSVLSWVARTQCFVNIELKPDVPQRFTLARLVLDEILANPKILDKTLLSTFDPGMVRALTRRHPPVPIGWLLASDLAFVERHNAWRRLGARAVHPEWPLATEPRIREWIADGALVAPWTVNSLSEARRLAEANVHVLITDDVRGVRAAVSRR